jgi:hypothetical protein
LELASFALAGVMSDTPRTDSSSDIPTGPPRDLHPVADIRFVMNEMGKLTAKVDRLIADVEKHGDKVDALREQMSYFKGAFWIAGLVFAACAAAVGWLFTNHATITFH